MTLMSTAVAVVVDTLRRVDKRDFEKLAGRTRALTGANFEEHDVAAIRITDPSTGSPLCWVEVICGCPQIILTRPWCNESQQEVAEAAARAYNEEVTKKIG